MAAPAPQHVTLRARSGLPSFRRERAFCFLVTVIARASRDVFRIVAFSVQSDHIHLLVEADDRTALTPREVRAAHVYVLQNNRKQERSGPGIDNMSSAPWFDGWKQAPPRPAAPSPVCKAKTWLARVGWRLAGGPICWTEAPAPSRELQRRATRRP